MNERAPGNDEGADVTAYAARSDQGAPYRSPWWLPGGHLQTIYSALLAPRPRVAYRRERWDTPDGDFIDLDWLPVDGRAAPLVVVFHGLEGCSRSHYALALMDSARSRGWRGVVTHFRGCSGDVNRQPRAYHSGDSQELDWILRALRKRAGAAPLFAIGVSLGGNVLLKWLGENGSSAGAIVRAAAAVSVPYDLRAAGDHLARGFNRLYTQRFLRTLKPKAFAKLGQYPSLFDTQSMRRAHTIRQYDNVFTAPLHGFKDTDDYWRKASSKQFLRAIRVPTLLLSARNDPFMPANALPKASELAACIRAEFFAGGGHAGFVHGRFPGDLQWLPRRVLAFFADEEVRREQRAG